MSKPIYETLKRCRVCKGKQFAELIDLGEHFITGFSVDAQTDPPKVPLVMLRCLKCGLVQLKHRVDPKLLYGNYYWYRCIAGTQKLFAKVGDRLVHDFASHILRSPSQVRLPCMTDTGTVEWRPISCKEKSTQKVFRTRWSTGAVTLTTGQHKWRLFKRSVHNQRQEWEPRLRLTEELGVKDRVPLVARLSRPRECVDEDSLYGYDAGYLIGAYLAEGHLITLRGTKAQARALTLVLPKDQGLCARVAEYVGGKLQETATITQERPNGVITLYLGGHVVNGLFRKFIKGRYSVGYHTEARRLSADVWAQPDSFLKGILDGWLDGDGHQEPLTNFLPEADPNRWVFHIGTNQALIDDLNLICLLLGYPMRYRRIEKNNHLREREAIHGWLRTSQSTKTTRQKRRLGDFGTASVLESHPQPGDHEVWDVDVGANGLFILGNGLVTHNSSMNKTMVNALHELAQLAEKEAGLEPGDVVVDIGCNDGTFFDGFTVSVKWRIGFEPGPNLAPLARAKSNYVFQEYFSAESYQKVFTSKAKLVTAIAMFYDLDDPLKFLKDVHKIMRDDGVFVIQMNDLYSMISQTTFDIIGHEHLCLYPLKTLQVLLTKAGFRLDRIEHIPLNGGSLRAWIRKVPRLVSRTVLAQLALEEETFTEQGFADFRTRVTKARIALVNFVREERARGGHIYLYGASTRGNTILQAAGLDSHLIEGAAEIHPDKIGKVIAGLNIPIVSEEEARVKATAFLVLPYSYRQEFIQREAAFLAKGGKLVFPLPKFEVVTR